jgi:hypothetical protein
MKSTPEAVVYHLPLREVRTRVRTRRILSDQTPIAIPPEHQFLAADEER